MMSKLGRWSTSGSKHRAATETRAWGVLGGMVGRRVSSPTARAICRSRKQLSSQLAAAE